MNPVEKNLRYSDMDKHKGQELVEVGSSTHFPNVQSMIQDSSVYVPMPYDQWVAAHYAATSRADECAPARIPEVFLPEFYKQYTEGFHLQA